MVRIELHVFVFLELKNIQNCFIESDSDTEKDGDVDVSLTTKVTRTKTGFNLTTISLSTTISTSFSPTPHPSSFTPQMDDNVKHVSKYNHFTLNLSYVLILVKTKYVLHAFFK